MSKPLSILTSASRTLGTLSLAGLSLAAVPADAAASPLQEGARVEVEARTSGAGTLDTVQLDSVHDVAQRLALSSDAQLAAFRVRWSGLPTDFQMHLAIAVRELDSDRATEVLVAMLDSHDAAVRALVGDALRAETGEKLPASSELWEHWLDGEKLWLRVRGAAVLEGLRSSDEALVLAATRELSQHRILKRAFAGELARNLGRISPAIRSVTAHTLGELGDQGSRIALRGALGDLAPAVRREAEQALRRLQPDLG